MAAATAPRASNYALEAGDRLLRDGSNFGGVGGLSAIAAYNSAERAALQLDNVDTPHIAADFALIGQRPFESGGAKVGHGSGGINQPRAE
ncbi:hypothetical protein [Rhizorhabdus dicambivorans]|uniref:hypothetical protein n=1 Tax=Rhizorhabdus dicambivorans TaxID=1850238 RepID=UPI001864FF41|nr:hypothetical protein [Rhizorhabdus dicambivorans]